MPTRKKHDLQYVLNELIAAGWKKAQPLTLYKAKKTDRGKIRTTIFVFGVSQTQPGGIFTFDGEKKPPPSLEPFDHDCFQEQARNGNWSRIWG